MADDTGGAQPQWNAGKRMGVLAVTVAAILLATACGSHPASPGAISSQEVTQNMVAFAQCMRGHGEPDFYYASQQSAQNSNPDALSLGMGYVVTGIDTDTAVFAAAMKSCQHLDTIPPPPPVSKQKLAREVKFTACMRAHGYPDYPDPVVQDGHLFRVPVPSGIDTTSPQFQAAQNACLAKM